MKKRKLLYLFPLAALILSGCDIGEVMNNAKDWATDKIVEPVKNILPWTNKEDQPEEEGQKPSGEEQHHEEEKPAPKEFEGLTLESATFTYDGQPHSISVQGTLPQGASVDYGSAGHEFTEVGEHAVTAVVSAEGYNSKTLTATLTIENAKFDREQVKLEDATVVYDGQEHTLAVTGAPDFATVEYGQNGNTFKNAGEYAITASVKAHGYENLDLSATLTIEKANFVGLKFEDAAYTVDGEPHEIKPVIPEEYADIVTITYSEGGNTFSEIGEYEVTVTVSADNYNDWVETATLTITDKKVFEGLSLEDKTVPYNGEEQTIEYSGTLPEGAEANYLEGYKGGKLPGTYEIKVEFTCVGYHTLVLSATLTIESLELEGISISDETVEYDGQAHTITPVIPDKYAGAEISYKENAGSFTDVGTHTVEAIVSLEGYNDWTGSAVLTILPAPLMVADFENLTSSDLVDMFTYQYYESSWTTPTESVLELIDNQLFEGGSKTLRANNTHNGCNWRIETTEDYFDSIKTGEIYKGISLDTCVDDLRDGSMVTVKVQLKFKGLPLPEPYTDFGDDIQVTYTVSTDCLTNWTHWEIPFEDPSMSIKAFGSIAIEYTTVQEMGYSVYDFIPYVSQMSVLVNANSLNYVASATYIDNICFTNNDKRTSKTLVEFENNEYTIASSDNTQFKLTLGDESARFESLNLEENAALEGTYTFNEDKLALNLSPDNGAHNVQFNLHALMNGSLLAFDDENALTGDLAILAPYAAHTDFSGKMFNKVFLMDDFESYEATGTGYDSSNQNKASMSGLRGAYYGEIYSGNSNITGLLGDSNWKLLNATDWSDYMELRTDDEVHGQYMDIKSNANNNVRYTNFSVVDGGAKPVGSGSNISFFAKASTSLTITFRAFYKSKINASIASTKDNSVSYTENIAVTTEWSQIIVPLRKNATVFGIMITSPKVNNARICIDNIQIIGEANPYASYNYVPFEFNDGNYCLWNSEDDAYMMNVSESASKANINKFGDDTVMEMDIVRSKASLTLSDHTSGGLGLEIQAELVGHGEAIVKEVGGMYASQFSDSLLNKKFFQYENVILDFSDAGSENSWYTNHWISTNIGSSSPLDPINIRSKTDANGNKIVNMYAPTNGEVYIYQPNLPMGPINRLDIDLGNYFGSGAIDYKFAVVDGNNNKTYLAGGAGEQEFAQLERASTNDKVLNHFTFDFDACIGYKFEITVKGQNSYVYVDNIHFSYASGEEQHLPGETALLNYDLQDKASQVGGNLDDSSWVQKEFSNNSWNVVTKKMNVRQKDSNIYGNMYCGYQTEHMYGLTPESGIGVVDKFSIDFANDRSGTSIIKVRIRLVLSDNSELYIYGGSNSFVEIPAGTEQWSHVEINNFGLKNVKGIKINVKNTQSADDYLYFDNIKLSCTNVQYRLNCTNDWDVSVNGAVFFAWVWGVNDSGHWVALELKEENGERYFEVELPQAATGMMIVRFNPSGPLPEDGSNTAYSSVSSAIWNDTDDLLLSRTSETISFAFNAN